jgi:hypothetical protein
MGSIPQKHELAWIEKMPSKLARYLLRHGARQEISNIVRTFKTDVDSLLSKSLGMDPMDVWGATSTRVVSLTSPPAPSDTRDDGTGSSKQPRVGPISSFPTSDFQTPIPLVSHPTPAAARFEVPVVCELVCHTCFVLLPFSAGPFTSEPSILCALSSSPSFHPPTHLHGRRQLGTHSFISIICVKCPFSYFL